mgnify:CR=1 FL=1
MSLLQSILLGVIQGIAEFLPISSSGHLVLVQLLFDINPPPFLFDIFLHLSTLTAVIIFFRKKIINLKQQEITQLVVGSIPAFAAGYLLRDIIAVIFSSSLIVGLGLLVTAVFNFTTNNWFSRQQDNQPLDYQSSFLIGLAQVISFIPGISRSGATIFAGAGVKLDKKQAFNFSFLLSIPVIIGANLSELPRLWTSQIKYINPLFLLIGGSISFAASLISLKLLKKLIKQNQYSWFGWYCLLLGSVVIVFSLFNHQNGFSF